jgi:hypothetical protein
MVGSCRGGPKSCRARIGIGRTHLTGGEVDEFCARGRYPLISSDHILVNLHFRDLCRSYQKDKTISRNSMGTPTHV